MIKQTLTPERINSIQFSLQKLAILSQMLLLENQSELDVDFRIPFINNFAKRIGNDCKSIQDHLKTSGKIAVNAKNNEALEEYSGEIWRIINLLSGLPLNIIKEHADQLESEFKKLSA